jgi:osmotically-inducible protein OsmY
LRRHLDGLLSRWWWGAWRAARFVATDRRTSGAQLEDEGIELRATSRIRSNVGDRVHVNLTSYNRQVLLTGEVPTRRTSSWSSRSSRAWRT